MKSDPRKEVFEVRTCIDCKKNFYISVAEKQFYDEKGFTLPLRCFKCRKARRAEKETQTKDY